MRRAAWGLSLIFLLCCGGPAIAQPSLDPEERKYFLVSAVFELGGNLREGEKVNLLSKSVDFGRGATGYALSLRGYQTSIRPQVLWSATEGEGGVYTFGDFPFRANREYVLSLVSRPGEFMALYVQDRGVSSAVRRNVKVRFLGGYDLRGVVTPQNSGDFVFRSAQSSSTDRQSKVDVKAVLIAYPEELKDARDKMVQFLEPGPEGLVGVLKSSEIGFWKQR